MNDEENTEEVTHVYEILPDMLWGCRVNDDEVRIYINQDQALTLSQTAVDLLIKTLQPFGTA